MKQKPVIFSFVSKCQGLAIRRLQRGEEGAWFRQAERDLQAVVDSMPLTGETDGQGDAAIVRLHYFSGSVDVWLTELDKGSPDDGPEDYQSQAFGLTDLGFGPEMGYVSLPEILGAGLEVDLHWAPKTVGEIRRARP